jgi:hypothetical protein
MTKTIILGKPTYADVKRSIEFFTHIYVRDVDESLTEQVDKFSQPHHWCYIELICKDYAPHLDLMFAYDDAGDRSEGCLMVGRWNDGVVIKHN